jgi:RND superfamily putative drug exporter
MAGLGRLAAWCHDHRRVVLGAWVVAVIAIIGFSTAAGSTFSDNFNGNNSAAAQAQRLLASRFPAQAGDTADVVFATAAPLTAPTERARVRQVVAALDHLPHVRGVGSPLGPGARHQISPDARTGFAVVQFDATAANLPKAAVRKVVDVARSFARPGFAVALGGAPISNVVAPAPGPSESIGIAAAIVIMLIAFGSVVAMGLPLLTALVGVGIGFGLMDLVSRTLTVPTFGPEMLAMIGLGVGIDYALFIVTRYRQGLDEGLEPRQATVASLATAGRAVAFAGGTVVISLCGLFVVGLPFMTGLAVGCILAVLLVMAGALTLLPALLGFTGRSIDRLHLPVRRSRRRPTPGAALQQPAAASPEHGFWWRWSRTVQRRPVLCGMAALSLLVLLAVPLFSMRLAFSDSSNDPTNLTTRQAYDLLAEGFGPGFNGPLVVVASLPAGTAASAPVLGRLETSLRRTSGVSSVTPVRVNSAGDAAVVVVYPTTGPEAAQTASLVRHLRAAVIPAVVRGTAVNVLVGGETAAGVDAGSYLSGRLPVVITLVIVLSILLLMAVFRSVAIPLKAAVMNLVSMGAAYGVIVAVYQWGWLSSVFGVSRTGPIDPWIPLMMFTIVFGLSMDYEVFLLSRIREEWRRTGVNSAAVSDGLAVTARVITAAAAIMVCVFGSFVVGDPLRVLDVFGLGLAVAVLVDATLVRMVLVPAVMQVLGRANWWMPDWLDRVVPTLGVEGGTA